jgi:hypothetical protein
MQPGHRSTEYRASSPSDSVPFDPGDAAPRLEALVSAYAAQAKSSASLDLASLSYDSLCPP